jgi:hypothetical protein
VAWALPAKEYSPTVDTFTYDIQLVDDEGYGYINLLSRPTNPIARRGASVHLFNDSEELLETSLIKEIKDDIAKVSVTTTPTKAKISRFWTASVPEIQLLDETIFVGSGTAQLYAECKSSNTFEPGLVSWSLYKDGVEVIKGHDYDSPGICQYTHEGLWDSGEYQIKAIHYSSLRRIALALDRRDWTLSSPSEHLFCGRLHPISPLYL